MAKILVDTQEFFDLIPLLILTAFKNDDLLDDTAFDFFSDIEKKVLPATRQYFLKSEPSLRRKLKFILKGIESGQNATITIRGDGSKSNEGRKAKYLTENFKSPAEIARKYLRS